MPKNNKIKILCLLIIGIVFLYIYGPIAFMKDGLVTRQSVNSFDELYELCNQHAGINVKMVHVFILYILDGLLQKLKKK